MFSSNSGPGFSFFVLIRWHEATSLTPPSSYGGDLTLTCVDRIYLYDVSDFHVGVGFKDERTRMASNSSSIVLTGEADAAAPAASADARVATAADGTRNGLGRDQRSPDPNHKEGNGAARGGDSSEGRCRVSGSFVADDHRGEENRAAGDHDGVHRDGDEEVFHSALQLADESDLEGLEVGGCAALVHQDTLYGDMQVSETAVVDNRTADGADKFVLLPKE